MTDIIIHVVGGIAEVVSLDKRFTAKIIDFDNYEDCGEEIGSKHSGYICPHCKKDSSEFMWNIGTMEAGLEFHNQGRIQDKIPSDVFTCVYCFHDHRLDELQQYQEDKDYD